MSRIRATRLALAIQLTLFLAPPSHAEDQRSARELTEYLITHYNLTLDQIASNLTYLGTSQNGRDEAHLVRWGSPSLKVAVITNTGAEDLVREFIASMDQAETLLGARASYCIERFDFQQYRPPFTELECLSQSYDVVAVLDTSPTPPASLLHDLGTQSKSATERARWKSREVTGSAGKVHCSAGVDVDQAAHAIGYGSAYVRVSEIQMADSRTEAETCLKVLPFLILGLRPVQKSPSTNQLYPELLELFYSPELRNGMTATELLTTIR